MKALKESLVKDGIPITAFLVDDVPFQKSGETSEVSVNHVLDEASFKTSEVLCPKILR